MNDGLSPRKKKKRHQRSKSVNRRKNFAYKTERNTGERQPSRKPSDRYDAQLSDEENNEISFRDDFIEPPDWESLEEAVEKSSSFSILNPSTSSDGSYIVFKERKKRTLPYSTRDFLSPASPDFLSSFPFELLKTKKQKNKTVTRVFSDLNCFETSPKNKLSRYFNKYKKYKQAKKPQSFYGNVLNTRHADEGLGRKLESLRIPSQEEENKTRIIGDSFLFHF